MLVLKLFLTCFDVLSPEIENTEVLGQDKLEENWALNTDNLRNIILECYKAIDEINRNRLSKP